MKNKFAAFIMLFATVAVMASCLGSNEEYTYSDDTSITSFSVTAAKQYQFVKTSDGLRDSIVTNDLTPTTYKFYINQITGEVYNPDSLPCGVDAKKLLVTASGGAAVFIKSMTSDSINYLSSTDSLDFSADRELQVVSNSGMALRKYTVHVNIHKEQPDSFEWHATADCEALKALTAIHTVAVGNRLMLFGTDGQQTRIFVHNGTAWTETTAAIGRTLSAEACSSVVVKDGNAYIADEGCIMRSADAETWATVAASTGIRRLVAAGTCRMYGYAQDGRLMQSDDNAETWTAATIDDAQSLLPQGETAYTVAPIDGYSKTERIVLMGNGSAAQGISIWGRIDEWADGSEMQPWTYYNVGSDNRHTLPALTSISAVAYDNAIYTLGQSDGGAAFYKSLDNGITWRQDTTTLLMPSDFAVADGGQTAAGGAFAVTVDANKSLWLVNAATGKTWRGRINRLGWKKEQTAFEE